MFVLAGPLASHHMAHASLVLIFLSFARLVLSYPASNGIPLLVASNSAELLRSSPLVHAPLLLHAGLAVPGGQCVPNSPCYITGCTSDTVHVDECQTLCLLMMAHHTGCVLSVVG